MGESQIHIAANGSFSEVARLEIWIGHTHFLLIYFPTEASSSEQPTLGLWGSYELGGVRGSNGSLSTPGDLTLRFTRMSTSNIMELENRGSMPFAILASASYAVYQRRKRREL